MVHLFYEFDVIDSRFFWNYEKSVFFNKAILLA